MSAHSPGPWTVEPATCAVKRSDGNMIAAVYGDDPSCNVDGAMRANARLIAAAPDLLALAKQYASECGECSGLGYTLGANAEHVDCPDCIEIRSVIAKAEDTP